MVESGAFHGRAAELSLRRRQIPLLAQRAAVPTLALGRVSRALGQLTLTVRVDLRGLASRSRASARWSMVVARLSPVSASRSATW
jgi:hypothetical protein